MAHWIISICSPNILDEQQGALKLQQLLSCSFQRIILKKIIISERRRQEKWQNQGSEKQKPKTLDLTNNPQSELLQIEKCSLWRMAPSQLECHLHRIWPSRTIYFNFISQTQTYQLERMPGLQVTSMPQKMESTVPAHSWIIGWTVDHTPIIWKTIIAMLGGLTWMPSWRSIQMEIEYWLMSKWMMELWRQILSLVCIRFQRSMD